LTPSQDKRITLLESKMFAMMACNDELVAKVDSLEKNIAEKEEKFDLLLNHSKRQDEKLETLKSMFKDILDESENLAFSFSLIEQKEKDNAEHFRTMRGDIDRINVDIVNQRKEVTKELGDAYNELKGEVATNKVSMEKAMKVIADKERSWEKKMEKSDKRMDIITNLNKKVLNDIDHLRSTTISNIVLTTLNKKPKEGDVGATRPAIESQNSQENNTKQTKTDPRVKDYPNHAVTSRIEIPGSFSFNAERVPDETTTSEVADPDQADKPPTVVSTPIRLTPLTLEHLRRHTFED